MDQPTALDDRWSPATAHAPEPHQPSAGAPASRLRRRWPWLVLALMVMGASTVWRTASWGQPELLLEMGARTYRGAHGGELYFTSYPGRARSGALVVEAWSPRTRRMRLVGRLIGVADPGVHLPRVWLTGRGICELILDAPRKAVTRTVLRTLPSASAADGGSTSVPRRGWVRCLPYGGGEPVRVLDGFQVADREHFAIVKDVAYWLRLLPTRPGADPTAWRPDRRRCDLYAAPLRGGGAPAVARGLSVLAACVGMRHSELWTDGAGVRHIRIGSHTPLPSGLVAAQPPVPVAGRWWCIALDTSRGTGLAPAVSQSTGPALCYVLLCADQGGPWRTLARSADHPGLEWRTDSLAVSGDRAFWMTTDTPGNTHVWGVRAVAGSAPRLLGTIPCSLGTVSAANGYSGDACLISVHGQTDPSSGWSLGPAAVVPFARLYRWRLPSF